MLIAGAGGQGKEILEILLLDNFADDIFFFDEDILVPELLYDKFKVLHSLAEVKSHFAESNPKFITGIGHPRLRDKMTEKLKDIGGVLTSVVSEKSSIFPMNMEYEGIIIQPGVGISHDVTIDRSCILHINSTVGHEVTIGKYVNIGPNSSIIGPSTIGSYCQIGANVTILPNIKLGENVVVGAGAVVDSDLEDLETFVGNRS